MSLVPDDIVEPLYQPWIVYSWTLVVKTSGCLRYYSRVFCYLQQNTFLSDIPRLFEFIRSCFFFSKARKRSTASVFDLPIKLLIIIREPQHHFSELTDSGNLVVSYSLAQDHIMSSDYV